MSAGRPRFRIRCEHCGKPHRRTRLGGACNRCSGPVTKTSYSGGQFKIDGKARVHIGARVLPATEEQIRRLRDKLGCTFSAAAAAILDAWASERHDESVSDAKERTAHCDH